MIKKPSLAAWRAKPQAMVERISKNHFYFLGIEIEDAEADSCANLGNALNAFTRVPSATFQILTSPFQLPEAIEAPSALKANA